jgi:hypothetical protein
LPAALSVADAYQASIEVDVVPVEPEQLAAAQAGVGEKGKHQPVALAFAGEVSLPDVVAVGDVEQAGEFAPVEHVGQRLPLLR